MTSKKPLISWLSKMTCILYQSRRCCRQIDGASRVHSLSARDEAQVIISCLHADWPHSESSSVGWTSDRSRMWRFGSRSRNSISRGDWYMVKEIVDLTCQSQVDPLLESLDYLFTQCVLFVEVFRVAPSKRAHFAEHPNRGAYHLLHDSCGLTPCTHRMSTGGAPRLSST
jgi:hypothetical protein